MNERTSERTNERPTGSRENGPHRTIPHSVLPEQKRAAEYTAVYALRHRGLDLLTPDGVLLQRAVLEDSVVEALLEDRWQRGVFRLRHQVEVSEHPLVDRVCQAREFNLEVVVVARRFRAAMHGVQDRLGELGDAELLLRQGCLQLLVLLEVLRRGFGRVRELLLETRDLPVSVVVGRGVGLRAG